MNYKINISEIVKRMQSKTGLSQMQIADQIFNKTKNNFNNQIRANRIDWDVLIEWAVHKKIDLPWLLTGSYQTSSEVFEPTPEDVAVHGITPGVRMARQFMNQFPDAELDDEGKRKLANIFQKLFDSRCRDLENKILKEMPGDIIDLAKGK